MNLEAEVLAGSSQITGRAGESQPLIFRSLQESASSKAAANQPSEPIHPAPHQVVDPEAIFRSGFAEGRAEGLIAAAQDMQAQSRLEKESMARLAIQFQEEKHRYFSEVEQEVVKLSLAIAERVLRRESEMDPTLLAAAARVALEQVADASEAVLRVSVDEVDRWNEAFHPAAKSMLIEGDKEMPRGECVLKTRSGTVRLGVRAQLQEIERGFFELLDRRPSAAVASC